MANHTTKWHDDSQVEPEGKPVAHTIHRWAKFKNGQTHRLAWHGLDVATVLDTGFERCPALLRRCAALLAMEVEDARAMLLALTALHDIGKVIASFQMLAPEAMAAVGHSARSAPPYNRREGYGHDSAGWALFSAIRDGQFDGDISDILPDACLGPRTETAFTALFTAFSGHHGHPSMARDWRSFAAYAQPAADLAAAAEFARSMIAHFGWRQGFPSTHAACRASYLLNGLVTLCDWLGSSEDYFQLLGEDMPLADYVERHARPAARKVLDQVCPAAFAVLTAAPARPFAVLFAGLAPSGGAVVATPMQRACERLFEAGEAGTGPLLVVIEDMTGAGKTEAADYVIHRLIAAGRAYGFFVGLPTMTTANQAFERRKPFIDQLWTTRVDRVLAHGRARDREDFKSTAERGGVETGEAACVDWFARSSKRALLAPAGVGTVDQALLAGLRTDYAGLRLLGLWGKVLVVDEVHAYDGYMLAVLEKLIEAHAAHGGSAVLMSATLPSRERTKLIAAFRRGLGQDGEEASRRAAGLDPLVFPALTIVHGQGPPCLVDVEPLPGPGGLERRFERLGSVEAMAATVLDHALAGRSVIWFRNTVDDAREAYEQLVPEARRHGLPEPLLWHARFLPADRARIEAAVIEAAGKDAHPEDRRSRIVVATQVGEQSLDLDFDALVSDLAPIDALIQRIGRTRRHRRDAGGRLKDAGADERPNLPIAILAPDPGEPKRDWYRGLLRRAAGVYRDDARLWLGLLHLLDPEAIPGRRRSGAIVLDDDLKRLIESVYAEDEDLKFRVPELLRPTLDEQAGRATEFRRTGEKNRLSFSQGFVEDCTAKAVIVIGDDDGAFLSAPTRLGESYTLLLAFSDEGGTRLAGWGDGDADPIAGSEIRVRWNLSQAQSEAAREGLGRPLSRARRKRLDQTALVVLARRGEEWAATVQRDDRKESTLRYCHRRGLMM